MVVIMLQLGASSEYKNIK